MKEIQLTKGKVALVNDADYERLNKMKWYFHYMKNNNTAYAARWIAGSIVLMHRFILNPAKDQVVDHIDGNGLNNQRENIRICTKSDNQGNRAKNKNNTSGYKGVHFYKRINKFRAQIKLYGKDIYLGYYNSPIEAARAYDAKARELFGEFANTNF